MNKAMQVSKKNYHALSMATAYFMPGQSEFESWLSHFLFSFLNAFLICNKI
jgi:hypothetical protein